MTTFDMILDKFKDYPDRVSVKDGTLTLVLAKNPGNEDMPGEVHIAYYAVSNGEEHDIHKEFDLHMVTSLTFTDSTVSFVCHPQNTVRTYKLSEVESIKVYFYHRDPNDLHDLLTFEPKVFLRSDMVLYENSHATAAI